VDQVRSAARIASTRRARSDSGEGHALRLNKCFRVWRRHTSIQHEIFDDRITAAGPLVSPPAFDA